MLVRTTNDVSSKRRRFDVDCPNGDTAAAAAAAAASAGAAGNPLALPFIFSLTNAGRMPEFDFTGNSVTNDGVVLLGW